MRRGEWQLWYEDYLQSKTWHIIRLKKLQTAELDDLGGVRCEVCREWFQLSDIEVHHLTYARVGGNERMEDLQVVCHTCHKHIHGTRLDERCRKPHSAGGIMMHLANHYASQRVDRTG